MPGSATAVTPVTRDQALASTPRLKIDTPELQGSINLTGAQLDDLHLTGYRETIDPKSPTIVLLSPAGTPNAFFAEQGFVGATGTVAKLPDSKTLWQAPADAVLGVGKPVTLTWDNGAGLVFTRQISIDDHFVFSVTQGVQNNSAAPVALIPYGRVQRQDTPVIAGWWVFFEGMLGVLGDKLQEIHYSDVQGVTEPMRVDIARRLAWLHRQVLGGGHDPGSDRGPLPQPSSISSRMAATSTRRIIWPRMRSSFSPAPRASIRTSSLPAPRLSKPSRPSARNTRSPNSIS